MGCTVSGLIASIPSTSSTEQRSADQNLDFKIVQFLISGGKILSYSAPRKYNFSGNFSLKIVGVNTHAFIAGEEMYLRMYPTQDGEV